MNVFSLKTNCTFHRTNSCAALEPFAVAQQLKDLYCQDWVVNIQQCMSFKLRTSRFLCPTQHNILWFRRVELETVAFPAFQHNCRHRVCFGASPHPQCFMHSCTIDLRHFRLFCCISDIWWHFQLAKYFRNVRALLLDKVITSFATVIMQSKRSATT